MSTIAPEERMPSPPYTNLLEESLNAWSDVRAGVIAEVANLTDDAMEFRPADGARALAELVQHVLENALLMAGELTRPDGDFRRKPYPDLVAEHTRGLDLAAARSRSRLLDLLRATHEDADGRFREAGELFMLQYIHRFDGLPGTRLAWLNHGIAHEYYHGGQIALYARLMNVTPALTRQIRGE